jgi:hypothetical protein
VHAQGGVFVADEEAGEDADDGEGGGDGKCLVEGAEGGFGVAERGRSEAGAVVCEAVLENAGEDGDAEAGGNLPAGVVEGACPMSWARWWRRSVWRHEDEREGSAAEVHDEPDPPGIGVQADEQKERL